jgi:DnaJ like chaperone protein
MADFNSLKAMFYADVDSDYKILEIHNSASDEELKKAYKKMAVKFHPDKVSHLGEEYQQDAKEKFQKVQQAYESIKKQRGIK